MTAPTCDALVLAGSRGGDDPVALHCAVAHKCLAPAGGEPMLARVCKTLLTSPHIRNVLVSLEDPGILGQLPELETYRDAGRLEAIASLSSPSLSVEAATRAAQLPLLVTTADHPLLNQAILSAFVEGAEQSGADINAGLTPRRTIEEQYPDAVRTYLSFKNGQFSGANLFMLRTSEAMSAVKFWRRVERDRKRPWRIARAFGTALLIGYLLRLYTLEQAMQRISKVMGARAAAVILTTAEAAIDVDKPSDLQLVDRILALRPAA